MQAFSVRLSNATVNRLNVILAQFNDTTGLSLSMSEWIVYLLKEIAIRDEYQVEFKSLVERSENDARKALEKAAKAVRQRLIDKL